MHLGTLLLLLALAAPAAAQEPAPGALLFGKRCGGCHTIGEGDRVGPDLLGVTSRRDRKWIAEFIRTPGAKIDAGDPVATELLAKFRGLRMPDQDLSDKDLNDVIDYLAGCTDKGGCKLVLGTVKHANDATPAEIARGQALFEGTAALSGGGPACLSCHNVRGVGPLGGGSLAKDLTFVYARLGDTGLQSALESTPFPLMKDIYAKSPLSADEAYALKAFFGHAAKDGTPPRPDRNFLYLGVLGLFAALGTIGAVWSGRLRGVRTSIVKRGQR